MFEVPKIVRTFGTVSGITEQPTGLDLGLQNASIKSIQSGTTNGSVTINAVDLNKAIARMRGYRGLDDYYCYLSSATQLMTVTGSARQWEVIEFDKVKSVQRGTANASSPYSIVAVTINAINTAKVALFYSFSHSDGTAFVESEGKVTNSTTLTFIASLSTGVTGFTVFWNLVETY